MQKPFTPNRFKVLEAAFCGDASAACFNSRRARSRALNDVVNEKLVYGRK